MTTKTYLSCAETAKLVRGALKADFPGIKFTVHSKTYSGGASIDVSWTDGPTEKHVEASVGKFAGASFDGMIDLKSYHDTLFNGELVHFGADYVFCNRRYSVPFLTRIMIKVCDYWGVEPLEVLTSSYGGDAYLKECPALWQNPGGGNLDMRDLIYREVRQTTG